MEALRTEAEAETTVEEDREILKQLVAGKARGASHGGGSSRRRRAAVLCRLSEKQLLRTVLGDLDAALEELRPARGRRDRGKEQQAAMDET